MRKTYTILLIAAVIILVAYNLLPKRAFHESIFPMDASTTLSHYDDVSDGGSSTASITTKDSSVEFSCMLGSDSAAAWCGIIWDFTSDTKEKYRNWVFVDSIIMEMDVQGIDEILVKLWTFDPDITNPKELKTYKLLMKEVSLKKGRQQLSIPMDQLYTPDFWYSEQKVDSTYNKRHEETVARLEITPGWNQKRGERFTLRIYRAEAYGISNLYFGIALFLFLAMTIIAVGRRHKIKSYEQEK